MISSPCYLLLLLFGIASVASYGSQGVWSQHRWWGKHGNFGQGVQPNNWSQGPWMDSYLQFNNLMQQPSFGGQLAPYNAFMPYPQYPLFSQYRTGFGKGKGQIQGLVNTAVGQGKGFGAWNTGIRNGLSLGILGAGAGKGVGARAVNMGLGTGQGWGTWNSGLRKGYGMLKNAKGLGMWNMGMGKGTGLHTGMWNTGYGGGGLWNGALGGFGSGSMTGYPIGMGGPWDCWGQCQMYPVMGGVLGGFTGAGMGKMQQMPWPARFSSYKK